jgi:hypothetical protein
MDATERILSEYREFPALRHTARQAARLWALEHVSCERLLNQLVTDGHLYINASGRFTWTGRVGHLRPSEPNPSEGMA